MKRVLIASRVGQQTTHFCSSCICSKQLGQSLRPNLTLVQESFQGVPGTLPFGVYTSGKRILGAKPYIFATLQFFCPATNVVKIKKTQESTPMISVMNNRDKENKVLLHVSSPSRLVLAVCGTQASFEERSKMKPFDLHKKKIYYRELLRTLARHLRVFTNETGLRHSVVRAATRATGLACTLTILPAGGSIAPAPRAPFHSGSAGGAEEGQDAAGRGAGGSGMGSSNMRRAHKGRDTCRISAYSDQRVSAARCAGAGHRRLNPVRRQEWTAGAYV